MGMRTEFLEKAKDATLLSLGQGFGRRPIPSKAQALALTHTERYCHGSDEMRYEGWWWMGSVDVCKAGCTLIVKTRRESRMEGGRLDTRTRQCLRKHRARM